MGRTSAQPQVNPSLLHSNSLKFQPLFKKERKCTRRCYRKNTITTKKHSVAGLYYVYSCVTIYIPWLSETRNKKQLDHPTKNCETQSFRSMEKLTVETEAKVVKECERKQDIRGGGVRGVIFRPLTSTAAPR
jgi:hypothetical protein